MHADTLPKALVAMTGRQPDRIALRMKEFGIWRDITWRQYLDIAPANNYIYQFCLAQREPKTGEDNVPSPAWQLMFLTTEVIMLPARRWASIVSE